MYYSLLVLFVAAVTAGNFSIGKQTNTNLDADGNPRSDVIPANNGDLDDIISSAGAIKAFAQRCLEMECPEIDSFYEALKDFESGMDNISGNLAGGEGTGTPLGDATPESLLGMSQGDINNHKSTLSDIKNTIEEAVKNGKDWRKTLRNGGAAAPWSGVLFSSSLALTRSGLFSTRACTFVKSPSAAALKISSGDAWEAWE